MQPRMIEERFAELVRAMVDHERSEAKLAVLFNRSVTAITNWYEGIKLPRKRDIEEFAKRCGITVEELCSPDREAWKAALTKVSSEEHVLITPAWLHLNNRILLIEKSTRSSGVIVITADARRRDIQDVVRSNIMRGVHYIYVIPEDCENERPLERFIDSIEPLYSPERKLGVIKKIRARRTKKTIRQWKRIGHVVLFARGEKFSQIDSLSDLARLDIDDGYEQLYKADDQPFGGYIWKTLSVREIDYYKELFEEWDTVGDDENEIEKVVTGLKLVGAPVDGQKWERDNIKGTEYVYNTVYRSEEGANARYVATNMAEVITVMTSCIEQGCHWEDIGLFGQETFIRQAYNSLPDKLRGSYSGAVLMYDIPIIQMRCINFKNNKSAVLVGWAFPGSDVPKVFLSEDNAIVNYFKSHFFSLRPKTNIIYQLGQEAK